MLDSGWSWENQILLKNENFYFQLVIIKIGFIMQVNLESFISKILEHVNFVGRVNRKGFADKYEPLIVSILPEASQNRYRIVIWSRLVIDLYISLINLFRETFKSFISHLINHLNHQNGRMDYQVNLLNLLNNKYKKYFW